MVPRGTWAAYVDSGQQREIGNGAGALAGHLAAKLLGVFMVVGVLYVRLGRARGVELALGTTSVEGAPSSKRRHASFEI